MPLREPESLLQGLMAGQQYDQQKAVGQRQMALENLMSRNRVAEHEANDYVNVPSATLHPTFAQFGTDLGNGQHRFNKAVLPEASKAAENQIGRESRAKQALSLADSIESMAPGGDLTQLSRPHQVVIRSLRAGGKTGDIDPKLLEAANSLIAAKPEKLGPTEGLYDPFGGGAVQKPQVDVPGMIGNATAPAAGGSPMKPSSLKIGTGGVDITTAPMGDQVQLAHNSALSKGLVPGTAKYHEYMLQNSVPPVALGPDGSVLPRGAVPPGGTTRPPTSTPEETKDAASAKTEIQQLRDIAETMDNMHQLQDWQGRASFIARAKGTNLSQGILDLMQPEERPAFAAYNMLRTLYERSQTGGSSVFRSPQMVAMLNNTIGGFTMPGQGDVLRKLAGMAEQGQGNLGAAQTAGGRRPIAAPPTPGSVTTTPPAPARVGGSPSSVGVSGTKMSPSDWLKSQKK